MSHSIQERLQDKEKEVKGMQKATSEMLTRAWEKGYIAGCSDGHHMATIKSTWVRDEIEIYCDRCERECLC